MSPTTRSRSNSRDAVDQLSDEGEMIVSRLTDKIDEMSRKFELLLGKRDERIKSLEDELVNVKRNLAKMEEKLDDADAYERRDAVVLSGDLPIAKTGENCSSIVRDIIKNKLNVNIAGSDISVARRVGKKPASQLPDKRSIIVKLCRRDLKQDLLTAARSVKPDRFFLNENLTPKRSTLLFALRQAKKKFPDIISGCNTVDGKVYVYVKPPSSEPAARNSRMTVNTLDGLKDFCGRVLKQPVSSLIDRWPHN